MCLYRPLRWFEPWLEPSRWTSGRVTGSCCSTAQEKEQAASTCFKTKLYTNMQWNILTKGRTKSLESPVSTNPASFWCISESKHPNSCVWAPPNLVVTQCKKLRVCRFGKWKDCSKVELQVSNDVRKIYAWRLTKQACGYTVYQHACGTWIAHSFISVF